METTGGRWTAWLMQLAVEALMRLGPAATRYLERLLRRHGNDREAYQVLTYDASLEVLDRHGTRAVYRKRERVRFTRDNVTSFYDYGWGTGRPFASHRVKPGRVVERRPVGLRHRSLILLPSPCQRGDELVLQVQRSLTGATQDGTNWLEAEVGHRMERLRLNVVLPRGRAVRDARLLQRRSGRETKVSPRLLPDGRQHLVAQMRRPEVGELYTLEWDW